MSAPTFGRLMTDAEASEANARAYAASGPRFPSAS